MEHALVFPHLPVDQLLNRWNQAIPVFMRLRMSCVGCPMSPFETLEMVAKIYGLPLDNLLNELETAITVKSN